MLELAAVAQIAKHFLQFRLARGVEAEGAHDLALGNVAAALCDEGDEFLLRRRLDGGSRLLAALGQRKISGGESTLAKPRRFVDVRADGRRRRPILGSFFGVRLFL